MNSLTQIYNSEGMRGSFDLLKKFTIVGTIVQFFLTVMGLLSNVSVLLRTSSTIFFLSNRGLWESVDEAKQQGSSAIKDAKGFDKIIVLVKVVLPNMKNFSDYNSTQFNLDDDDTTLSYILKSGLPTIAIIFFSTMAFNGLLFQIYANITDGMVAVAEQARDLQIAKTVDAWFSEGKDYNITIDKAGTPLSKIQGKVSKSIYVNIVGATGTTSKESKAIWGSKIETFVTEPRFADAIKARAMTYVQVKQYVEANRNDPDAIWKSIKVTVNATAHKDPSGTYISTIREIGEAATAKAFFIPGTMIFGTGFANSPSFTGYMITVSADVPSRSTFELDATPTTTPPVTP